MAAAHLLSKKKNQRVQMGFLINHLEQDEFDVG